MSSITTRAAWCWLEGGLSLCLILLIYMSRVTLPGLCWGRPLPAEPRWGRGWLVVTNVTPQATQPAIVPGSNLVY